MHRRRISVNTYIDHDDGGRATLNRDAKAAHDVLGQLLELQGERERALGKWGSGGNVQVELDTHAAQSFRAHGTQLEVTMDNSAIKLEGRRIARRLTRAR